MTDEELFAKVAAHSLVSHDRLSNLAALARSVNRRSVPGDFVECGTYKGGTAAVIGSQIASRNLWLFDSFEGLPQPSAIDGVEAGKYVGDCRGSEHEVRTILETTGFPMDHARISAGWFKDTLKGELPREVALLHCDADWYDPVLLVLETFYDRMPAGAVIILDDFGYWEGAREAFYDFCFRRNEKPLLQRCGDTQAWWIKGQTHCRT
jgi:O-methyltransferase